MEAVRGYILSIIAAALFCGILKDMVEEKTASGGMLKLAAGIFLLLTLVRPLARFSLADLPAISSDYLRNGETIASEGTEIASAALAARIKEQTEAYILDKAQSLQADITAEVTVSGGSLPVPVEVRLSGRISPYARMRLSGILEEELGIAKEDQIWIG